MHLQNRGKPAGGDRALGLDHGQQGHKNKKLLLSHDSPASKEVFVLEDVQRFLAEDIFTTISL